MSLNLGSQDKPEPGVGLALLHVVWIGEGIIGGIGAALALAGALNVAAMVMAMHPFGNFQDRHLGTMSIVGGMVGGLLNWLMRKRRQASPQHFYTT